MMRHILESQLINSKHTCIEQFMHFSHAFENNNRNKKQLNNLDMNLVRKV